MGFYVHERKNCHKFDLDSHSKCKTTTPFLNDPMTTQHPPQNISSLMQHFPAKNRNMNAKNGKQYVGIDICLRCFKQL